MRSRALCTATVHVSSWNGLGLRTWHFWRVDTTCSLSINKHTSYWESSLWIQRMAATAPQNSELSRSKNLWHSSSCPQLRRLVHQMHSDRFLRHQVGCIIHHPHII